MQRNFSRAELPAYRPVDIRELLVKLHCTGNAYEFVEELNMKRDQKEQREVSHYILAYLSDNPDAGDTFEGLVEWWLLDQKIKFETRNVSEAVARLISEGLIVEHEEPDSRIIYKVNQEKKQTIRKMLSQ
jgi:hypothetical protein